MAKINKKHIYPDDMSPSVNDYLIGTDGNENNLPTKSFPISSLIALINADIGQQSMAFKFSTDPLETAEQQGVFKSEDDLELPDDLTKLTFNKKTTEGVDVSILIKSVVQSGIFAVKLTNVTDPNNYIYLKPKNYSFDAETVSFEVERFTNSLFLNSGDRYVFSYELQNSSYVRRIFVATDSYYTEIEDVLLKMNSSPAFTKGAGETILVVAYPLYFDTRTQPTATKYLLTDAGNGRYGFGATQLTAFNLELIKKDSLTIVDVVGNVTTQSIDFGEIGVEEVWDHLNADMGGIALQNQSQGYRVFKILQNGVERNFLFTGAGGDYGFGGLQSTQYDFQEFNAEGTLMASLNKFLRIGEISVSGDEVTIIGGVKWTINGAEFDITADIIFPINLTTGTLKRNDIIVANEDGTVSLVTGVESSDIAPYPLLPIDSLLVTVVNVTPIGLTIDDIEAPFQDQLPNQHIVATLNDLGVTTMDEVRNDFSIVENYLTELGYENVENIYFEVIQGAPTPQPLFDIEFNANNLAFKTISDQGSFESATGLVVSDFTLASGLIKCNVVSGPTYLFLDSIGITNIKSINYPTLIGLFINLNSLASLIGTIFNNSIQYLDMGYIPMVEVDSNALPSSLRNLKAPICNLNLSSVNNMLVWSDANVNIVNVELEGGTNAAPTGAGITAKNNLIANGKTVTTN